MRRWPACVLVPLVALGLLVGGCSPATTGSPSATTPPPTTAKIAAPTSPSATVKAEAPTSLPAVQQPSAVSKAAVDFPAKGKNVTILVGQAAGGSWDLSARLLAVEMEKELGVPVQVVCKPGALNQLMLTELAGSKPDGYTLGLVGFVAAIVTYVDPERKAVYNRKSFQPIGHYQGEEMVVVARENGPYLDLNDLIQAAKQAPEKVKVATGGLMGNSHLIGLNLEEMTGVRFAYVHYDSVAQAGVALLGGHVDAAFGTSAALVPNIKGGLVRVLATGAKAGERNPLYPYAKTMEEQGVKITHWSSVGVAGPAGMPAGVVDVLAAAMKKGVASPDLQKRLAEMSVKPWYMSSSEFESYWIDYENMAMPLIRGALERAKK